MAVLLHDRSETAGQKQREALRLPRTSAVVALFAFSSRMDRDSMRLFARTHGDEVRAAAIASTGQEVLELLHGGLRPQVLVLDALLTKPSVTQVLQEISAMQPDPEPAVLVLVPVPEETAARKALGLFAQYRIMLRPYGIRIFSMRSTAWAQRTTSIGSTTCAAAVRMYWMTSARSPH